MTDIHDDKILIRSVSISDYDYLIDFKGRSITTAEFASRYDVSLTPTLVFLDADERFGPGSAEAIRAAVEEGGFDCGMVAYHNASRDDASVADVLSGAARLAEPVFLPRLFRLFRI